MASIFAWICAAIAAVATLGAAYFFDKSAEEGISAANERAGVANESAGKAHERAAALEAEAARLRLELDREIEKRAQRQLNDVQRSAFSEELAGKISEIAVVSQHDLETRSFTLQIIGALPQGLTIYSPEAPREDKWFAPAGLIMYSPEGSSEEQLKNDPLYKALKRAGLFGGLTTRPFLSPDLRGPVPAIIEGYAGRVLYIGQKSPF